MSELKLAAQECFGVAVQSLVSAAGEILQGTLAESGLKDPVPDGERWREVEGDDAAFLHRAHGVRSFPRAPKHLQSP